MTSLLSRLLGAVAASLSLAGALRADTITGSVVDRNGVGVVGCVIRFASGGIPDAVSGANGLFFITVNPGRYDFAFLPPGTTLAARQFLNQQVAGTLNLGQVQLAPGFTVSGGLRDNLGAPVVGGNIDVIDQASGTTLYTPNDGTDTLGNFLVVVPAGTYRVRCKPLAGALLVTEERRDVVITTAGVSLGNVALRAGLLLSGTVLDNASSLPVAGVDIDVEDGMTGEEFVTPSDDTTATGAWSVVVPPGILHVSFDPPATSNYMGTRVLNLYTTSARVMAPVRLSTGIVISGRVLGIGGAPIANADLDVLHPNGAQAMFTSNDNTDASGNFRVVVPAGSYLIDVEPSNSYGVLGYRSAAQTFAANTALPDINLATGVAVSGSIRAHDGSGEADADLDFLTPGSGVPALTPGDRTGTAGTYLAQVPAGTWDVRVQTRKGSMSRSTILRGVVVNAATTLDIQLSQVPVFAQLSTWGLPVAAQSGLLPALVTLGNPTAQFQTTNLSLVIVDPTGLETPLLTNLTLSVPPGFSATQFTLLPLIPLASYPGRLYRYELRCDDPSNATEQDRDRISFFLQ